jgi:hypothetical protein
VNHVYIAPLAIGMWTRRAAKGKECVGVAFQAQDQLGVCNSSLELHEAINLL